MHSQPFLRSLWALALFISSPWLLCAAELDRPPAGAFTIVVIPDTQGYMGVATKRTPTSQDPLTNPVFQNHTRWIVENLTNQAIVFVTHVGDIVDVNREDQWTLAKECLRRLHGVVPYSLTVGNHDMKRSGDSTLFQQTFPAKMFSSFSWYGGSFQPDRPTLKFSGNNANSYQLFSAGGLDFLHLSLECNAPDDVLAWADGLLRKYASRRALITTHMDLGIIEKPKTNEGFIHGVKGRMRWTKNHGNRGNTAEQMWEKLYRKHANLGFVFSGDQSRATAWRLDSVGDHGNIVHACLSDYESNGPIRLYRFLPDENKVVAITYDTTRRALIDSTQYVPDRDQHQFALPYAMTNADSVPVKTSSMKSSN